MPEDLSQKPTIRSMTGSDTHVILQKRDLLLLSALATLRIIDREQTRMLCGFHSLTRVNTRLLKLSRAGLLRRFFFVSALGGKRAIYCLSKKGAVLVGARPNAVNRAPDSFLIGDKFTAHQLAINQVYCAARSPLYIEGRGVQNWHSFTKPLSASVPLIPDAYLEICSNEMVRPAFLEVDRGTEGLPVWTKKINEYLSFALQGEFERLFSKPRFAVLVVALSQRRMQSLRVHVRTITPKLFYFTTIEKITPPQGFWSPIWFRPEGEHPQSLI